MLLTLLTVSITALLSPQASAAPPVAGVRVAGLVFDAETRNPIAGARVMLMRVEHVVASPAGPLEAVTDAGGRFVFGAVEPGRYRIDAQKTGFAPFADPFGGSTSETLEVAGGHAITGLELPLRRGGAIAGRILDTNGQPLSEITVTALWRRGDGPSGRPMAITTQMAQTNDLGEFRLAGLPEGPYVIIAAPRPDPPFARSSTGAAGGGLAFAPTYYPGTTNLDEAQIINVASAQTVDALQFSLIATPAYQVSGVVVDEAGSPLSGAMVTLIGEFRKGGPGAPAMGRSDENGTFRIGGVVSGTYRVMASMPMMWSARDGAGVGAAAGGFVAVTGGVYVGGAGVGGPGVPPPSQGGVMQAPIEVTVDNGDVTGLKVVLTMRR